MNFPLMDLWLPIVLSAAAVWIVSSVAWMMLPHHKKDIKNLPNEDALISAVRAQNIAPGIYNFPDMHDFDKMKDPAFKAKIDAGPIGTLHVWPPGFKMGGKMVAVIVYYLAVSALVALLAAITLHRGEDFHQVFHVTTLAAVMAYCLAGIPNAICFNTPLRNMAMNLIDGIVYGLITGVIFTALWPKAATLIGLG